MRIKTKVFHAEGAWHIAAEDERGEAFVFTEKNIHDATDIAGAMDDAPEEHPIPDRYTWAQGYVASERRWEMMEAERNTRGGY